MLKNRSNIYIADKSVKFCRDVRFGLLIKKNMAPREIQTLTLAGAIKRRRVKFGKQMGQFGLNFEISL